MVGISRDSCCLVGKEGNFDSMYDLETIYIEGLLKRFMFRLRCLKAALGNRIWKSSKVWEAAQELTGLINMEVLALSKHKRVFLYASPSRFWIPFIFWYALRFSNSILSAISSDGITQKIIAKLDI